MFSQKTGMKKLEKGESDTMYYYVRDNQKVEIGYMKCKLSKINNTTTIKSNISAIACVDDSGYKPFIYEIRKLGYGSLDEIKNIFTFYKKIDFDSPDSLKNDHLREVLVRFGHFQQIKNHILMNDAHPDNNLLLISDIIRLRRIDILRWLAEIEYNGIYYTSINYINPEIVEILKYHFYDEDIYNSRVQIWAAIIDDDKSFKEFAKKYHGVEKESIYMAIKFGSINVLKCVLDLGVNFTIKDMRTAYRINKISFEVMAKYYKVPNFYKCLVQMSEH